MMELSSVVKTLTPEQDALFKKHKAYLRGAMIQAAGEIGSSVWREVDDAALDTLSMWLYQRAAECYSINSSKPSTTVSSLQRIRAQTQEPPQSA